MIEEIQNNEILQFGYFFSEKNNILSEIEELSSEKQQIQSLQQKVFYQNNTEIRFSSEIELRIYNDNGFIIKLLEDNDNILIRLLSLRSQIENIIKTNEFQFVPLDLNKENEKTCTRFFYYENQFIDFEKLLEDKSLEKNIHTTQSGTEIPVENLLKFIGAENEKPDVQWNGSQYITQVEIENFKIFNRLTVDLSNQINILIGRNGLGKTSFLQALTLGLLPSSNVDKSNEFEKYISFNFGKSEITLRWQQEYRKIYVFKNELRHTNFVDSPQKLILSYGVNLNTDEKLSHSEIIEQILEGNALPYSTKSIFKDFSTDFYDPIILLERLFLEKKGKQNKFIDSIINLIKKYLNEYLDLFSMPEKIKLESHYADFYFIDLNKNKLKTQNLSEGYKDFVLQITDIVVRIIAARNAIFDAKNINFTEKMLKQVKGIIIIDEFDRHLHPELQRKLLHKLKVDFQNIQFVLSTHNIFSLQSAEGNTALIIQSEEGKLKIETKDITKGLSLESIYNSYFEGNSHFFGYETELLLKTFKEYIDKQRKEELTNKEAKEFKNITKKLLEYSYEIQGIVTREIRQFERLTEKTIKL
jgi:predicted ATP-binding protein involved in virulence